MLNDIAWSGYWYAMTIITTLYYGCVMFVYFRNDLVKLSRVHHQEPTPTERDHREIQVKQSNSDDIEDPLLPVVQSLSNELTAYLQQIPGTGVVKTHVVYCLQKIVRKYAILDNSVYQNAINKMIQFECNDKCAIHLSAEDVKEVWKN